MKLCLAIPSEIICPSRENSRNTVRNANRLTASLITQMVVKLRAGDDLLMTSPNNVRLVDWLKPSQQLLENPCPLEIVLMYRVSQKFRTVFEAFYLQNLLIYSGNSFDTKFEKYSFSWWKAQKRHWRGKWKHGSLEL